MAKLSLDSGWWGLEVGTRWRDASGTRRVVILAIQRSGVIVYRHEDAPPDDERVTNVVRFVETYGPADGAPAAAYASVGSAQSDGQA
ncbi:MAG TPA: hypothetical protein VFH68_23090 [Polyangia bacterium]|jgi:hypothetical protein|nr:hypothetical protein [Polyangia bacterium]